MVLTAVRATLLVGPTALAFASGGYFREARLVAAIVVWIAVAAAALALVRDYAAASRWPGRATPGPLPAVARAPFALALGGLALLAAWTALSITWAPLREPAADSTERAVLYLGALLAAALALRPRDAARWAEPVLAGGILVVVGYGLAGRVLPGIVELERTLTAGGRLDQPLTYWNAQGALAALGVVLVARMAGDRTRPLALRMAAAAAAAPLGLGVYLTFSRGALTALAVGLAVLLALTPTWAQLRAAAIVLEAGIVAAIAGALLPAVEDGEGSGRTGQGLVMLAVLLVLAAVAALLQRWSARSEDEGTTRTGPLPWHDRTVALAWAAAALMAIAPFAAGVLDRGQAAENPAFGASAERLRSAGSFRFEYWEAAVKGFADEPALGSGAGSFPVVWLREREIEDTVRDAHSLPLETAAELGLIGLALLLAMVAGVALAAVRVARHDPGIAAGPIAGLAVWTAHSAIDWDWEMPALTLVAAVLAGLLLAQLTQEPPFAAQSDGGEEPGEHEQLHAGLPGGALAAPQRGAYG